MPLERETSKQSSDHFSSDWLATMAHLLHMSMGSEVRPRDNTNINTTPHAYTPTHSQSPDGRVLALGLVVLFDY